MHHKIECRTPEARANQVELVEGMKALLAEFGDVDSGGTEGWTYDEDDDKAGGCAAGKKTNTDAKEEKRKAAAAALLSQFIPTEEGKEEEGGGDGGVSKGSDK